MLEELRTAGNLLNAALERYRTACLALANSCDPGNPFENFSQVLSDVVRSELESIASYETKVQEVKAIVCQARNILPTIVPITVLPSDILTQIFRLILNDPRRYCCKPGDHYASPLKYPETLSCVCTRWRRVAISSHVLWSHIDIAVPLGCYGGDRQLLTRAKAFAARAFHAPLDVHISSTTYGNLNECDNTDLHAFCASIATRIRSLELSARFSLEDFHFMALRSCFVDCAPGTMHQLVITGGSKQGYFAIQPTRRIIPTGAIALPQQHLEDLLRPIKLLRLNGVYFDWTSQVYHGLVELHLTQESEGSPISITQSHLAKIITASPGLHTFCFGIKIIEILPHGLSCAPISLPHLEVVDLRLMEYNQYDALFQLVSPSSTRLRLSLDIRSESRSYYDGFSPGSFFAHEFFTRSTVTELSISSDDADYFTYPPLVEFLMTLPLQGLQSLLLSGFSFERPPVDSDAQSSPSADGSESEYIYTYLDTLHLEDCAVAFNDLQQVAETFPLEVLKIRRCTVLGEKGSMDRNEAQDKLAKMFPAINLQ